MTIIAVPATDYEGLHRQFLAQRWSLVRDVFGTGTGVAIALCRRFNLDPDEILKK